MFVTGLLLAAESSPHLGVPWQLLAYEGETILGCTLGTARTCGFDQLIVTLGSSSAEIHDHVDFDGVRVVESPHADTARSSIVPALDAVDRRTDGLVILRGDQPGVTSATVWSLVAESATPLGSAHYDDGPGHPVWCARELFGALRELRTDDDLWTLTAHHPHTQVDAIGNLPLAIRTWDHYHQATNAADHPTIPPAQDLPTHHLRRRRRTSH